MFVYEHYIRLEPEYWSLHYMLARGVPNELGKNIVGSILQMQYGQKAIYK